MGEWMKCWNENCTNDTLSPRAIYCPICHTQRPGASEGQQAPKLNEEAKEAQRLRESYLHSEHPNSHDLTDQQWYNVCKFHPKIAARCSRKPFSIGHFHPLDATASQGPLLTLATNRTPDSMRMREPGEDD